MAKLLWPERRLYYSLSEKPLSIGRCAECNIQIQDSRSSRWHCEVGQDEQGYYIKDLNSYNGTFLNNQKVSPLSRLQVGDQIQIGNTLFFVIEDQAESNPLDCDPTVLATPKDKGKITSDLPSTNIPVVVHASNDAMADEGKATLPNLPIIPPRLPDGNAVPPVTGPAADAIAMLSTARGIVSAAALGLAPHSDAAKQLPVPDARFIIGNRVIALVEPYYGIGRRDSNKICIKDNQVSGHHAELVARSDGWWITNLKSRNGVIVNGKMIESCLLKNGDKILLGDTTCFFQSNEPPSVISKNWVLLLMIVLLVVGLTTSIVVIISNPSTIPTVTFIPNNILKDFSFEEGFEWEYSTGFSIQRGVSHSGKAALVGTPLSGAQANCSHTHPIAYNKCYSSSFWIKSQEWSGWAGMKVTWLQKNQKLGESYSPLIQGTHDWKQVQWIAQPPPYADQFQLSLLALGTGKVVYFDDIGLVEENNSFIEDAYQSYAGCRWFLNPTGMMQLESNEETFQLGAWEIQSADGTQVLANHKMSHLIRSQYQNEPQTGTKVKVPQWEQCEGISYLHDPATEFPTTVEASIKEQSWNLSYQITTTTTEEVMIQHTLILPKHFFVQRITKPTTITENELTWYLPKSKKRLTLTLPQPTNWQVMPEGTDLRFTTHYPIHTVAGKWCWTLQLQISELANTQQLQQWLLEAQTYQQSNNLSKAIQSYHKITNQGLLPPEFASVPQTISQLEQQYQQDSSSILQLWNQARFFNNLPAYQLAWERALPIIAPWKEPTQESASMQEIIWQFQTELQRLKEIEQNRSLAKLVNIAQRWQTEKAYVMAKAVYQEIIVAYPDTPEATQAKLEIQKMNQEK